MIKITEPSKIDNINELPLNLPFKAKIQVKSLNGKTFDKFQKSSIFPPNWDLQRVKEEVAWVYENTAAKGKGLKTKKGDISNFEGISTNGFEIRIQIKDGNIINAHPVSI